MLEYLETLDRQLFLELNSHHTPFMDKVMWYISTLYPWIIVFLFFFYYAYKKGQIKLMLIILAGLALCTLLADRTSVMAFKNVFLRYRPSRNLDIQHLVHTVIEPSTGQPYIGGWYGFVSSHATNFFAASTFIFFMFKSYSKWWGMLFLWAGLIAYSRIYLGVHYPADIVGRSLTWIWNWLFYL